MLTLYPTVVIGLGTTGARIIEGVQQRMYEMFKVNTLPIFEYIVIETDRTYGADQTPGGQSIDTISLSSGGVGTFSNFEELLDQLEQQNIHPDWIDRDFARKLVAQGEGAGGVRPVGRLILWANMKTVKERLDVARRRILSDEAVDESERLLLEQSAGQRDVQIATTKPNSPKHPHAIVCGTSTGGTYSGAFIDLGYLCQSVLQIPDQDRQSLYNLTLLPPHQMNARETADVHRFKANAYGVLDEGEYFAAMPDTDRSYDTHLPSLGSPIQTQRPPFHYTYLVSQEYGGGSAPISSPDALADLASLKLFCDLIGLEGVRVPRIVDKIGSGQRATTTFGLAAITHPRYQISEYVACQAGETLAQRWIDAETYVDRAGQERPVPEPGTLARPARRVWEGRPEDGKRGLLEPKMEALATQEADLGLMMDDVRDDVDRLKDGRKEPVLRSFREPGDTYFGRIQRNVPAIGDEISDALRTEVYAALDETQSIPYAISYARALKSAAQNVLDYWERLGIPFDPKGWDEYVNTELEGKLHAIMNDTVTRLRNLWTTQADLAEAALLDAIDKLRIHMIKPRIEEVRDDLDGLVEELETYREMMMKAKQVFSDRQREIQNAVEDTSLPIGLVWAKGSFQGDVEAIRSQVARSPSARDLAGAESVSATEQPFDPDNGSTWLAETLKDWHSQDENRYTRRKAQGVVPSEKMKQVYQGRAIDAVSRDLKVDISDAVDSKLVDTYFGRGKECHLRYKHPDGQRRSIGEYLIGPKGAATRPVRDTIQRSIGSSFPDEGTVALPGLDHIIIYYREEPVGNPLKTLSNVDDLDRCFRKPPQDPGMQDWVREHWSELRIAYDVPAKRRKEEQAQRSSRQKDVLHDLLSITGDFFIEWQRVPNQGWVPTSLAPEADDLPLTIGPGENGGPPQPKWTVKLPQVPVRSFRILDGDGNPKPDAIRRLTEDAETARSVLDAGRSKIQSLGREGMLQIWERSAMPYLTQRYGEDEAVERARHYFGTTTDDGTRKEGAIAEFLSAAEKESAS